MKTADLARSKRLKELGWEQEGFLFHCMFSDTGYETKSNHIGHSEYYQAPAAGEMIEWLLKTHDIYFEDYQIELIGRNPWGALNNKAFSTKDGNENALADACAWVLERKV